MYITNRPEVAQIAEECGVDRIFIDLEKIGKQERQRGMNTVQSNHSLEDIKVIRKVVKKAEILVRSNPIHEGSEKEIEQIIENGADTIMLPYFKTIEEVKKFFKYVNKRVHTCLLLETPEAVEIIDEILELPEVEEVHVGLNDLHLGYQKNFMFELLTDGTVEMLCKKFHDKGIQYGFGGCARIGKGMLPAELILSEHTYLQSQQVILSRSFCDVQYITDTDKIREIFSNGIRDIRNWEKECEKKDEAFFVDNREHIKDIVDIIVRNK